MGVDYSLTIDETVGIVASEVLEGSGAKYAFVVDISLSERIRIVSERANTPIEADLVDANRYYFSPTVYGKIRNATSSRKSRSFILDENGAAELSRITRITVEKGEVVIVVPYLTRNFAIAAIGATKWTGRPLNEITYLLETTSLRFLGTSNQSQIALERLTPRLSEIVATNDSWETSAHQICRTLARHFGFRSSTFVAADGDRLIPLVGCDDVENGPISVYHLEGPLETIHSIGEDALIHRAIKVVDTKLNDALVEAFETSEDLTYGGLVIPLTRGDQRVGVLVMRSPYDSNWLSLDDLVKVDQLVAHLSILFSQVIDFYERELRLQASDALAMMLDAATSILSQDGIREFIPRSLATSLGSNGAIYLELDPNRTITDVSCAGDGTSSLRAIRRALIGSKITDISVPGFTDSRNHPFFAEPHQSELYTSLVASLTTSRPYVAIPIHTSQGLVGVAAAILTNERSFWSSLERHLTNEWAINATLVTENYQLRSQEKINLERFREMAFRDSLTTLPNRDVFQDRLRVAANKADRSGARTAVIFIDIDHFKLINDTYGHRFGDEVLKEISNRLSRVFREGDTVARISGDEFTVLIEDSPEVTDLTEIARRAFERLNEPYVIDSKKIAVSISMGMTSVVGQFNGNELLDRADNSMYHSKKKGRSRLTYSEGYGPGTVIATSERTFGTSTERNSEESSPLDVPVNFAYESNEGADQELIVDITETVRTATSESKPLEASNITADDVRVTYQPFYRFSLDYIDIAKIRLALSELTNGIEAREGLGSSQSNGLASMSHEMYIHSDSDTRLELLQPSIQIGDERVIDLPLIEELAARKLSVIEMDGAHKSAKFLIPIDDVATHAKDRISVALEKIISNSQLNRRIVLAISAKRLANDEDLMVSLIAIAIRYRLEVMVTDVEDRRTRFYDLCSPVVTYFAIEAVEAIGDSNRPAPTKMSTLLAIAKERGVRIVATKVTDSSMVDSLLATGISVVDSSGIDVVDLVRQPLERLSARK